MTTFNVQLEVPDGTTPEQLHEDLCLMVHEDGTASIQYVDVGFPIEEPTYRTHVDIAEWDNRDPSETWLWIDKVRYISVDPFDMIENMVENCRQWIIEEEGVNADELDNALAVLKRASGR